MNGCGKGDSLKIENFRIWSLLANPATYVSLLLEYISGYWVAMDPVVYPATKMVMTSTN